MRNMIERSSNVPPEFVSHSHADLNLPEHYDAKVVPDTSLPEYYEPSSMKMNDTAYVDPNPAHEKQVHNPTSFEVDDVPIKEVPNERKYFGLRPKVFYLCLGGFLLIIIAAAVGGGVGHYMANKNKQKAAVNAESVNYQATATTSAGGSSSTSASTGTAGNDTSPATRPLIRGLAATEVNVNIILTHQDDAADLYYMAYYSTENAGWAEKEQITLKTPATANTSLTSASWNTTDTINVRTYYVATNDILQEIVMTCNDDSTGCKTTSGAVSGNIKLNSNAGLAAVAIARSTLRVFTLDDEGNVSEIQYNSGSGWGSPTSIGNAQADPTSPLAVALSGAIIWLFWFTTAGELQCSRYGSSWSSPTTLATVTSIPASLTAALSQEQGIIHVFYPDGKEFQEVKYSSGTWAAAVNSTLPASSMDNGPLAAVGWNGTESTRVYYLNDGKIQEAEPSGESDWTLTTGSELISWEY